MRAAWIVAIACACGHEPPQQGPRAMPVELYEVKTTRVADTSEYLGTLRSRTAATLQPQVDGQIIEILVQPGQVVEAGQPLVKIDPGRAPSAVAQFQASRAARQAQLDLAQLNLERVRRLVATGALAEQELDNARAVVDSAKADVAALGAEIAGSRVQLGYYRVLAPAHGEVGDIPVRVGDRVTSQTVITTVTDNRVLEANIAIPVERAHEVRLGTGVQLVDEDGKVTGEGPVSFVAPLVDGGTQSVLAKAQISNPTGLLRTEQVVRARVVWSTHDGIVVPALAITRQGGQPFVFVATAADGGLVAKQRPVQLGELTNNAYVVTGGLRAGERVVTSQIQKLRDGAPIAEAPPQERAARPGPR